MRSSRLTIAYSHEIECELSASVSPGSPEVRDVESPMCGPATGPDVDDVRLELTREQREAVFVALNEYKVHGIVEAFTLAVLRALDPTFADDDHTHDAFVEALGTERERREAAADDAAEARAEHRRLHPDDYRYPLYLEED